MYFYDTDETVYCKNCGKETRATKVRVCCEEFDYPRTGMKDAWVSECCKDELSPDPVTDVCAYCGETAEIDDEFTDIIDGDKYCPTCADDYRIDHPDMEEEVARAEWREER